MYRYWVMLPSLALLVTAEFVVNIVFHTGAYCVLHTGAYYMTHGSLGAENKICIALLL